jgi:thioesterase domain-containing protein
MSMSPSTPAPHGPDPATAAALAALDAHLQAMPPVAALGLRIAGYDGARLRLQAPLSANVNDKGCAFGGSLASLMTLAGWGLATLQLQAHGLDAAVYVADSQVRYLSPLYGDLDASAWLADGDWDAVREALRTKGRASMVLQSQVAGAEAAVAASGRARYVAIARARDADAATRVAE